MSNEPSVDKDDGASHDQRAEHTDTGEGAQTLTSVAEVVSPDPPLSEMEAADHPRLPVDGQSMEPKRSFDVGFIRDIPVHISVELGRRKMAIKDVLGLGKGAAIVLSNLEGEALDIRANNRLIAKGEVLVENDKYGIRIKEIITSCERLDQLMR